MGGGRERREKGQGAIVTLVSHFQPYVCTISIVCVSGLEVRPSKLVNSEQYESLQHDITEHLEAIDVSMATVANVAKTTRTRLNACRTLLNNVRYIISIMFKCCTVICGDIIM